MPLFALLFACSGAVPEPVEQVAEQVQEQVQQELRKPSGGAEFVPAVGRGQAPSKTHGDEANTTGPWNLQIRMAVSDDGGLSFQDTGEKITDQGGVPSLAVHDGQLFAYYIAWQDGENFTAVASRPLDKPGKWTYRRLAFEGEDSARPNQADPHVVALGDGRLRMYYTSSEKGQKAFHSAISTDGLRFVQEKTPCFTPGEAAEAAMVLKVGDGWLMFAGPMGRHAALSKNGTSFSADQALRVGDNFMPFSGVQLPDGSYRLFGSPAKGKARTATSRDGKSWKLGSSSFWPGGDGFDGNGEHGMVAVGKQLWMAYTAPIEGGASSGSTAQPKPQPKPGPQPKPEGKKGSKPPAKAGKKGPPPNQR